MKNIKNVLTIIFAGLLLSSCTDFGDTNLDPTKPVGEQVNVGAIIPTMQGQTHRNMMGEAARLAGIITQQLEGFDAQQVAFTQYAIDEGTLDNFWKFGLYSGSMRDCNDIIERAKKTGEIQTVGLAKIYLAANLGLATNIWGDIPYTEAFKGDKNLTPKFDPQKKIYESIQSLLDEAINDLLKDDIKGLKTGLVGKASPSYWIKVAHALKARYYIQLSKRNSNAPQKALEELTKAFTNNKNAPTLKWENSINGGSPFAKFGIERKNTMIISDYFADLMSSDIRKDKYMVNDKKTNLFYKSNNNNLFWAQLNSPSPLISFWELKFIEAEAKLRVGQNALPALKEAITANMEFLGIATTDIIGYTKSINTANLKTIITEKYKALYGNNPIEVWNDYRRTGFPKLTANPNGANGSNPTGIIPRRFLYPRSERLGNEANYKIAITNQGGHLQDVDLWAFK